MKFHARFPSACRADQAVRAPAAPAPALMHATSESMSPDADRHWRPSRPLRMRAAAFLTTSDAVASLARPTPPAALDDALDSQVEEAMHIHVSAPPPSDYYRTTAPYVMVASEPFDTLP